MSTQKQELCGHEASGNGFFWTCDLPPGHNCLHRQRTQLHDGVSVTNWGDDGKAPWATSNKRPQRG